MSETIKRDELKSKIDRGEKFPLPLESYRHAHLPGAINLPPERVRESASSLLPDKSAETVVYCASPT